VSFPRISRTGVSALADLAIHSFSDSVETACQSSMIPAHNFLSHPRPLWRAPRTPLLAPRMGECTTWALARWLRVLPIAKWTAPMMSCSDRGRSAERFPWRQCPPGKSRTQTL